jgi:hypothetical protein
MKFLKVFLLVSLAVGLVSCSGQLTTREARIGVLNWSRTVDTSGTTALGSDEVSNNTGRIVIKGIQESPQDNSAKADIEFNNFKFSGSQSSYSGTGTATFSRYNDGTWVLKKVSVSGKNWDNLSIETR